jgi:hypothetical protein
VAPAVAGREAVQLPEAVVVARAGLVGAALLLLPPLQLFEDDVGPPAGDACRGAANRNASYDTIQRNIKCDIVAWRLR